MYLLYSAALALALILTLPYWLLQMARHGKYSEGLRQRLGKVPQYLSIQPVQPVIWVHAVSVGEVLAISGLIDAFRSRNSDYRVLVSTTTDAGQKLAQSRFGQENVFYFPLDFEFVIRPYLQSLRPELIVLAETEFWPNFLRLVHTNSTKVAVVNARISDRSWPGYRRFRSILPRVLGNIDLFLAQTEQDAQRLVNIGALPSRVQVSGNLKFDVTVPAIPEIAVNLRQAFQSTNTGPVIVCGSTVEGEEPLLLHAFENVLASYPNAVMILAPRHPERFPEVARLLEQLNIPFWRRSLWNGEPLSGSVLLLDSIGELAGMYALGDVAFVGGSLVPRGGHNIIEPAQHGIAIMVGNHTENFREIVGLFQTRNAVRVVGQAEFPLVLMELLSNEAERKELGKRASDTLNDQMGATQRTLKTLQRLLDSSSTRTPPGGSNSTVGTKIRSH